ncbi:MAG: acyloxyacyl hydrolase [Deltaproteobacteria bacterium]|jgi:hypothetical protein|nr:acyloxyacyl hydrolase [Deltaproteobacteria bacterium]MCW8893711.1 acyloxyacyl hydrolase [Deltaproteobacteria bacterium]MCW9049718.1 acyloxyacyl hydrolase [Deltaproteobacteria bacterium]
MRAIILLSLVFIFPIFSCHAEEPLSALSIYTGQLTTNHFEDFFTGERIRQKNSYLLAVALARQIGRWEDRLSYELEGQLVKHFKRQDHWEFNLLGVLRWEKFFWDQWLETSAAFGLGPSYATAEPEVEIEKDGESARFMVYWMLELAVAPFKLQPRLELISRIHHRSNAFGLVADNGGSNALTIGFKYRF